MNITVYQTNRQGIFLKALAVDPMGPMPAGAILTPPPPLSGTEAAQWMGAAWRVLPNAPAEVPPDIQPLRSAAIQRINVEYTARTSVIAQGYPDYERESWPVQIEEANALLANESADTPWIDAAAASRGITRLDLAQRIKANDVAYRRIHGALSGIRQALETQVMAVPDDEHAAEAFAAIQWPPDQATDPT